MFTVDTMLAKLSKLLRVRFDAELCYKKLEPADRALHDQLLSQSPLKQDEKWIFPVFREYQLVGCAIVTGIGQPLTLIPEQLVELIELYLDAAIALTDRIDMLEQTEKQIHRTRKEEAHGQNVIPLRKPAPEGFNPAESFLRRLSPLAFAMPCLLEGTCENQMKQFAVELHELSGRYAFIYLSDLDWSRASDLDGIGPVTLYVPNLATLTLPQQLALTDYLKSRPGAEQPQVVAATLRSYSDLRQSGLVTMDLLYLVSVCYMKMDRPFREYRREGIVEFFFGNSAQVDTRGRLI